MAIFFRQNVTNSQSSELNREQRRDRRKKTLDGRMLYVNINSWQCHVHCAHKNSTDDEELWSSEKIAEK